MLSIQELNFVRGRIKICIERLNLFFLTESKSRLVQLSIYDSILDFVAVSILNIFLIL